MTKTTPIVQLALPFQVYHQSKEFFLQENQQVHVDVLIAPGQITLTRIRSLASSRATIFVNATCAALVQEYAVAPELLNMRVPFTEEVITIAPPCFFK